MNGFKGCLLRVVLLGLVLLGSSAQSLAAPVPAQTPTPPCLGTACGRTSARAAIDPRAITRTSGGYSCSNPPPGYQVQDVRTATAPVDNDQGVIVAVLRYSSWCKAYWAYGFYTHTNQASSTWNLEVQVTTSAHGTVEHYLTGPSLGTSGYTDMYSGPAEACADFSWSGRAPEQYRVCTNRMRLELVGSGSFGTVGTTCANPTANPGTTIWRFRVVGLPSGVNQVRQLVDGRGAFWKNVQAYPCERPYYWPLVQQQIIVNNTYGGVFVDVVAYPGSQPTAGAIYTAEVFTSLQQTVSVRYTP